MATNAIREALRQLVNRLEAHPTVEFIAKTLGRPASARALAKAQAAIPSHLLDVYGEVDGFKLEWRFRDCSRTFAQGNGGSLWMPSIAENSRGFRIGFEVSSGEPVQLLDHAPRAEGFTRCAATLQGEGVVLFDGDEICGSFASASDFFAAAIECCGAARWLDLFADGARIDAALAIVNENRARLGMASLGAQGEVVEERRS